MSYPNPWDPGYIRQDTAPSASTGGGGIQVQGTTPQPAYNSDEPWVELEPLKKVSIIQVWNLLEALRAGGVPVLGSKPKRSGLFSGKLIDVQLRVPQRLEQEAKLIVVERLGVR